MTEAPRKRGRPKLETTKVVPRYKITEVGPQNKVEPTLQRWLDFYGTYECSRLYSAMLELTETQELRDKYPDYKVWNESEENQFAIMIEAISKLAELKGCLVTP